MTPVEQAAFVKAYYRNVSNEQPKDYIAECVRKLDAGEVVVWLREYTRIADAMFVWNEAIRWRDQQQIEELT